MPDEALPLDALIGKLFIERRDVKAVQNNDGSYHPDKSKFTRTDIQDHLAGKKTYGHYLVDPVTEHCRLFCFDIDLRGTGPEQPHDYRAQFLSKDEERVAWLTAELRCFAMSFDRRIREILEIPTANLFSGNKGVHVYGFTGSQPATAVRDAADLVLKSFGDEYYPTKGQHFFGHHSYPEIELEIYPKQKTMDGKEYGNLLRLPLGINRKSGKESFFFNPETSLWEFDPVDPLEALRG